MAETEPHLIKPDQNRGKSTNYFTSFLYKASLALVFLVIIPLFPSQAPEFINQTVPNRSWELLHLVFVGIAVSYGLFSSRNQEEAEKEANSSKFDSAQSYVSRLLQVSSVFEDEAEAQPGSGDETGRLETWSSQYFRSEPVVVLAKGREPSVVDQRNLNRVGSSSSRIAEKPLLLPVRSLKSRVSEEAKETFDELSGGVSSSPSFSRSSSLSGSKGFLSSQKLRVSEAKAEEKEAVVLPSPIPWRSRSGRMEMNEELLGPVSPFSSMPDFDYYGAKAEASKLHIPVPSRPDSGSKVYPSPRKSPLSSESQAKTAEDFVRRKSFQKSSPPPPPPPPPFPATINSSSMRRYTGSGSHLNEASNKDLRRSYSSEPKGTARAYSRIEMKPRSTSLHDAGKSVRTFRSRNSEGFGEYDAEEAEELLLEKTGRKTDAIPNPSFFRLPEEEKDGFLEDVVSDSEEDSPASEKVEEAASGTPKNEEVGSSNSASDGGPDVDKKADEFIAKFREQIRLQRIDSIKRSTVEISRSLSR